MSFLLNEPNHYANSRLVVEDEAFVRMDAVEILRAAGFGILEAANADEAIQLLERHADIRLIFTDIDMTDSMNGLKLAAAVRDRWPPVRIIATSGHFKLKAGDLPGRRPVYLQALPTQANYQCCS